MRYPEGIPLNKSAHFFGSSGRTSAPQIDVQIPRTTEKKSPQLDAGISEFALSMVLVGGIATPLKNGARQLG